MDKNDYITSRISARIRQERKDKKLSQEDVINLLGDDVSISTLSRYENGHGTMTVTTLAKIAQALDLSASDLLCEAENLMADRWTAWLVYYFPLISKDALIDALRRVGARFYGREDYVKALLHNLIMDIPSSPAKKWADFNVHYPQVAMKYQRTAAGARENLIREYPEVIELFGDEAPENCYRAYLEMLDEL